MNNKTKVAVFGIDGASWNVLEPLMDKGLMPNLSKLLEKGVKGTTLAPLPANTVPAWINFATGVNPAKHGCYSFFKLSKDFNRQDIFLGEDVKVKRFYEYLDEKGKRCVIVNLPGSFPMDLVHGRGMASFLNPASELNWYPKSLNQKTREVENYKVFPDIFHYHDLLSPKMVDELLDVEERRFTVGKRLFEGDWDFFFYLVSASDWLMHKVASGFYRGEAGAGSDVEKLFSRIDEMLGWFLKRAKNTNILVISDHGFRQFEGEFYINKWLEEKGWLKRRLSLKASLKHKDKLEMAIERKMDNYRTLQKVARFTLKRIPVLFSMLGWLAYNFRWFHPKLAQMGFAELGLEVDRGKTYAYSNGLFIRFSDSDKKTREKIRQDLKTLKFRGKSVFKGVHKKESVYSGRFLGEIPELVLEPNNVVINPSLGVREIFGTKRLSGHSSKGILATYGPDIKRKGQIEAKLIDIAPTILELFNHKIPGYMEGKPIF